MATFSASSGFLDVFLKSVIKSKVQSAVVIETLKGAVAEFEQSKTTWPFAQMDHSAPWAGQNAEDRMELDEPRNDEENGSEEGEDNNMSADSSEEEEDDPEEARKIQEGFIVDEDEEDEEEESEDEGKDRDRHKHKKRKRRKGQRLPVSCVSSAESALPQRNNVKKKKKAAKQASSTRTIWRLLRNISDIALRDQQSLD